MKHGRTEADEQKAVLQWCVLMEGKCVSSVAIAALEENQSISRVTIIWSTVHPAMRLTAILNGGERRMKRQIQDCWRNSREK